MKMKNNQFISMIFAVLLLFGGSGVFLLVNDQSINMSAQERVLYANENSISYYTSTKEDEGVVVSYYAPTKYVTYYSKTELEDYGDFIFQSLSQMGTLVDVDGTSIYGISSSVLSSSSPVLGEGKNCDFDEPTEEQGNIEGCGYGTVTLDEELNVKPYSELSELYALDELTVEGNEVILSKKSAELLNVKVGDTFNTFNTFSQPFVVKEIIEPQKDISLLNSSEFFEKNVNIPFIYFGDSFLEAITSVRDAQYHSTEELLLGEEYDYWKHEINEYKITFANHEMALKFIENLQEWMKDFDEFENNPHAHENYDYADAELNHNNELKKNLEKEVPTSYELDARDEFYPINPDLSIAETWLNVFPSISGTRGNDDIYYSLGYTLVVKNTGTTPRTLTGDEFKLKIMENDNVVLQPQQLYKKSFPKTINPGEESIVGLIYSFSIDVELEEVASKYTGIFEFDDGIGPVEKVELLSKDGLLSK